jgi:hypothetical protein
LAVHHRLHGVTRVQDGYVTEEFQTN